MGENEPGQGEQEAILVIAKEVGAAIANPRLAELRKVVFAYARRICDQNRAEWCRRCETALRLN